MKQVINTAQISIVGTTATGKSIYRRPELNHGFKKEEHMDAYRAHLTFMTFNDLNPAERHLHRRAMNEHYLAAVS